MYSQVQSLRKVTSIDKNYVDNLRVAPEDIVKTIGLFDAEAKILTEEMSNSMGRQIIQTLSSEELTTAELAKKLNVSIQNAAYHMKRLSEAGIAGVVNREISSRGKITKRYALIKPSFLLVVDTQVEDKKEYLDRLRRIALRRFFERVILSAIGFVSSSLLVYWLIRTVVGMNSSPTVLPSNGSILFSRPLGNPMSFQFILLSLSIGLISGIIVWYLRSRRMISITDCVQTSTAKHF